MEFYYFCTMNRGFMDVKKHIKALGFIPKSGTSGIYHKVYLDHDNYVISIDFDKEHIEYGDRFIAESKNTQNFSQPENFVVLECVDRLLLQGYKPQNIILEKTWPSEHGIPNKTIFSTGFALIKSKREDFYITKLLYFLFMFSDDLMKQMETAMPKAAYPSINEYLRLRH